MSANPNPISTASFSTAAFSYNELYASETISRSGTMTGPAPNTLVPRGTVLFGNILGVPQTTAYTVGSGTQARAILAADVTMPAAGAANILAYIQGKFLESGMTFSAAGPTADAAGLWEFGVYVLDVMDRTGLTVPLPLDKLAQEAGPPHMTDETRRKANEAERAAIRAAGPQKPPTGPDGEPARYPTHRGAEMPAWAEVAFENAVKPDPEPVDPHGPIRGYREGYMVGGPHDPERAHAEEHLDPKHVGQPKHADQPKHVDQPKEPKK